jgi:phosphoribosylamine--glycine ligase
LRVLLIDPNGNGLDFAMRAQKDGHDVKHFIPETEKTKAIGQNLVPIIRNFNPFIQWADLIFLTDNTKYLRQIDALRNEKVIIGPTKESAEWELDRVKGMQVLKAHGTLIPPYKEFNDYDEAIKYVKKRDTRLVSKPSGDADKSLSYVAKSPVDLVYMLERWKKLGKLKSPFILQDFVEGIEIAIGGWFGPHGFNRGWCENFEFKKLMNGDMGVNTGEQGTVLRFVAESLLANQVLAPLTKSLLQLDYIGYIDVNCLVDDKGQAWPLEFTMRPGWPTLNIQMALHEGDSVEWLAMLAEGEDARNFSQKNLAIGVVLSVPDYPYSHLTRKEVVGVPIYGVTPSLWEHIHPCEMMMDDQPEQVGANIKTIPMPCTAGDYVLVMTAIGETVTQCRQSVYRRLKKLKVPNSPMWRTDIGTRLSKELPLLQKFGYAKGMIF